MDNLVERLGGDQATLILIVVAAVLLALVAWLLLRRRRPRTADLGIDLDDYRQQNPCFFKAIRAVSEQGLVDQLKERGDVRAALKLLATRDAERRSRKKDRRSSMLDLPGKIDNRQDAAVMTILRAIYMDEVLCHALPNEVLGEVDRYLDSLTA
jgi:LPXTG-motif cell wall-anchored protein